MKESLTFLIDHYQQLANGCRLHYDGVEFYIMHDHYMTYVDKYTLLLK